MTEREQLWYLINEYQKGNYDSELFADEFTRIYHLEMDSDSLSKTEYKYFSKLGEIASLFTNDSEILRISGFFYSEDEMRQFILQMLEYIEMKETLWIEQLKSYQRRYYYMFGYTPDERDYICTRDIYASALLRALEEKKELSEYLQKRTQ